MTENQIYNEKELLSRIVKGDESAYKMVFLQYWPRVYSTALIFTKVPALAEDAAQEVFAQLWIKRALLADVKEFRTYLFSMARNLIFNTLRTKIFTGNFDEYLQEYFADSFADPAALLEFKEAGQIIEKGIDQLTPQQQKVFRMSRFQGLSHAEIAKATGLSPRTVKNYMVAAIQSLRGHLDEQADSITIFLWVLLYL
ncbi:RNA polymerase sigma-70 factor [Chitinophaga sp. SYP-B3965]|uniref:RNA polymerase sigma factor n=1 Tax=Chitinophaga sp. SYP-B3965 TaxID=2663120 RepID=UPI001299DFAC|nr:RNA polymerase sigma-70 factor [Chitinophaga sp. SYP-B3965]MRG45038.1 RNA polymerase sigma-70 factor [Chitinophaga sp. SYP-B3965]